MVNASVAAAIISLYQKLPHTIDRAAKEACVNAAHILVGDTPPQWFLRFLEWKIWMLAAHRVADEGRHKTTAKRKLTELIKLISKLQERMEDPVTVALLAEKKYREARSASTKRIEDLRSGLGPNTPANSSINIYHEKIKLLSMLGDIQEYARYKLGIPELRGAGRGRLYLRENVSPKLLCAVLVIVSRRHFLPNSRSGKRDFEAAEILWVGSRTALGPDHQIKPDHKQNANDLSNWRRYFALRHLDGHFAVFEDCRLALRGTELDWPILEEFYRAQNSTI